MQAKNIKHEKKAVNQFSCAMELVPFTSVTFLHVTQGMKLTIVRSVVCVGSGSQMSDTNCLYWTHLKYCTSVKVLRRGDDFLFPCCQIC